MKPLEEIIYLSEKPSRYMGGEFNQVLKPLDGDLIRFAFAFPDIYEVGMSHLGLHILYNLLNDRENIFCERVFSPWVDMEKHLKDRGLDLFTLETKSSLRDMDFIGFTLQYELSYTNILKILELSGIPYYAEEREASHPLVMAGGSCGYNPEPLALIMDLFVIGEGEEITLELLELYEALDRDKEKFLFEAAKIPGVYVPKFYEVTYDRDHRIESFRPNTEGIPARIGKRIVMIVHGDHPWTTACSNGAQKVADAYDIDLKIMSPNWDLAVQNQMIDQAINERPDMILLIPLDAKTAPQQARKINRAGVPLILFNTLPSAEAMDYAIAWTGPDDFGQFRILSRLWADALGKEGGVAYVQHAPGGSPYFARCFGPISELSEYAPEITVLDKQAPGFEADKTMQLVSDWLTRFGDDLKGICAADDSAQALGIFEALSKAGREDVIVVAAGNSKVGMDLVKDGKLYAITYQTAEGDGALAVKTAADWFNGLEIEPVRYLPQHMITAEDVEDFYPPQW